jgi:streptogramin lyase
VSGLLVRAGRWGAALVAAVAAVALAPAAAAIDDRSGQAIPNSGTDGPTAQLAAPPRAIRWLADPASPLDDDPLALAKLGSPGSPESDLAAALETLAATTDPAAARAARGTALDILEGERIDGKAYSGLPLLNWNSPAKVKTVPAGGEVTVNEARFGEHVIRDTWLLEFEDPEQPFSITYRIAELGPGLGGALAPTPLLADGGEPVGGLHSAIQPLALPSEPTGTLESSRFHPDGAAERTRRAIQEVTVRMPSPRHLHTLLDPASQPPGPTLASVRPATPELLAAARDAFGFSGGSPTDAERTAAIGKLGDGAPEKLLWSDLRSLDPDAPDFLERARTLGEQDSQLVDAMRTRSRLPSGVGADPAADVKVVLMNNEAYVSRPSVRVEPGGTLRVEVINRDGFAHRMDAIDLFDRRQVFGPLDWGEFQWAPLALGASEVLEPGAGRVFTLTPAATSRGLVLGDPVHGDQATAHVALERGTDVQSLSFAPDFTRPLHQAQDGAGNLWVTLAGVDKIARVTPADDLDASRVQEFPLPGGAHRVGSATPPLAPHDVVVDAHGIVWATLPLGNAIARLDPGQASAGTSAGIRIYKLHDCPGEGAPGPGCEEPFPPEPDVPPTRQPLQMKTMLDGDGNTVLWFTETGADRIGVLRVDRDGRQLNLEDLPCGCSRPLGIGLDPDGSIWFTSEGDNRIGRLSPGQARPYSPSTAQLEHFDIPSRELVEDPGQPPVETSAPHSLALDPEGRVWFSEEATAKVAFLDPARARPGTSQGFTEFPLPTTEFGGRAAPADLAIDQAGTAYFADEYGDQIMSATPAGVGRSWRPAERQSLTDSPLVDAEGNLWFVEHGANLLTRVAGVTAGVPVPGPPPLLQADTSQDRLTGRGLRDAESVDVAVLRDGSEVAHADSVPLRAGAFTLGSGGDAWQTAAADPIRAGDRIRVATHGRFRRSALTFTVAALEAGFGPDGAVTGRAAAGGEALAGAVELRVGGASGRAGIDPDDGRYGLGLARQPTGTSGTVSWTGATVAAAFRTVTGFAVPGDPPPEGSTPAPEGSTPAKSAPPRGRPAPARRGCANAPWIRRSSRGRRLMLLGRPAAAVRGCLGSPSSRRRLRGGERWRYGRSLELRFVRGRVRSFTLLDGRFRSSPGSAGVGSRPSALRRVVGHLRYDDRGRSYRAVIRSGALRAEMRARRSRTRPARIVRITVTLRARRGPS